MIVYWCFASYTGWDKGCVSFDAAKYEKVLNVFLIGLLWKLFWHSCWSSSLTFEKWKEKGSKVRHKFKCTFDRIIVSSLHVSIILSLHNLGLEEHGKFKFSYRLRSIRVHSGKVILCLLSMYYEKVIFMMWPIEKGFNQQMCFGLHKIHVK